MVDRQTKLVGIVLIVIAAVLGLWVFVMWMMPSIMRAMMGGSMMRSMNEYMGPYSFGPLLLAAVLIVLAVALVRRGGARNGEKR